MYNKLKVYKEKVDVDRRVVARSTPKADSVVTWLKEQSLYYLISPVY